MGMPEFYAVADQNPQTTDPLYDAGKAFRRVGDYLDRAGLFAEIDVLEELWHTFRGTVDTR